MSDATDCFYYSDEDFYFRALRASDLDGRWTDWLNDPRVTRFQAKGIYPNTRESQSRYFEMISGSKTDVVLAIVDRRDHLHVGNVGLHQIDYVSRTAVLGILLGEKSAWGKGIGRRSWQAITNYGFEVLNLHKICATVMDGNEPSIRCALKAGFEIEGRQKAQMYKNGKYLDLIHFGLLREKWSAL